MKPLIVLCPEFRYTVGGPLLNTAEITLDDPITGEMSVVHRSIMAPAPAGAWDDNTYVAAFVQAYPNCEVTLQAVQGE